MQMNSRLAIRELCMHEPHVFEEYRTKIIDQCQEHRIVLTPDCFYSQTALRKMVRDSDNVFLFSNTNVDILGVRVHPSILGGIDMNEESDMDSDEASLEHVATKQCGKCIYIGDRHVSSPRKESHPKISQQFYSTL